MNNIISNFTASHVVWPPLTSPRSSPRSDGSTCSCASRHHASCNSRCRSVRHAAPMHMHFAHAHALCPCPCPCTVPMPMHMHCAPTRPTGPALFKCLSNPSEEVVRLDIEALAHMASSTQQHFGPFIDHLLSLFKVGPASRCLDPWAGPPPLQGAGCGRHRARTPLLRATHRRARR